MTTGFYKVSGSGNDFLALVEEPEPTPEGDAAPTTGSSWTTSTRTAIPRTSA